MSDPTRAMFEESFQLVDDGTMDTVIGCRRCDWVGRYNPEVCADDGHGDGGEPYTDAELDHMRIMEAYTMAAEDHPR